MDFEPTDTQKLVRSTARDYAARVVARQAAVIDRDGVVPRAIMTGLGELGLLAVNVAEELGGAAAGTVAYSLAMTEISKACASTAVTMAVTNMVGEVIARFGTDEQRATYNQRLSSGAIVGAFALSEADAGSDPGGMRTTARQSDAGWVLDGTKQWISHADSAGVLVVWARTGNPGPAGLSCFLVDQGTAGLKITGHEDKMGLRGSHTCSLVLEGCHVGGAALLGELNGGFKVAMMALDGGRIGIGSQAIGIAEAALEAASRYCKERKQFGKSIGDYQAIQWMIADSRTELDAARVLVLRAALLKDSGTLFSIEASMAKLFASEAAWRVCNRAVQIHGGYGYVREFPVERHLRDVRVTQIYEGTSEVQRLVISRALLKKL